MQTRDFITCLPFFFLHVGSIQCLRAAAIEALSDQANDHSNRAMDVYINDDRGAKDREERRETYFLTEKDASLVLSNFIRAQEKDVPDELKCMIEKYLIMTRDQQAFENLLSIKMNWENFGKWQWTRRTERDIELGSPMRSTLKHVRYIFFDNVYTFVSEKYFPRSVIYPSIFSCEPNLMKGKKLDAYHVLEIVRCIQEKKYTSYEDAVAQGWVGFFEEPINFYKDSKWVATFWLTEKTKDNAWNGYFSALEEVLCKNFEERLFRHFSEMSLPNRKRRLWILKKLLKKKMPCYMPSYDVLKKKLDAL